jgi:hypothetical protein
LLVVKGVLELLRAAEKAGMKRDSEAVEGMEEILNRALYLLVLTSV